MEEWGASDWSLVTILALIISVLVSGYQSNNKPWHEIWGLLYLSEAELML